MRVELGNKLNLEVSSFQLALEFLGAYHCTLLETWVVNLLWASYLIGLLAEHGKEVQYFNIFEKLYQLFDF